MYFSQTKVRYGHQVYTLGFWGSHPLGILMEILGLIKRGVINHGAPVSLCYRGGWYLITKDRMRISIQRES